MKSDSANSALIMRRRRYASCTCCNLDYLVAARFFRISRDHRVYSSGACDWFDTARPTLCERSIRLRKPRSLAARRPRGVSASPSADRAGVASHSSSTLELVLRSRFVSLCSPLGIKRGLCIGSFCTTVHAQSSAILVTSASPGYDPAAVPSLAV